MLGEAADFFSNIRLHVKFYSMVLDWFGVYLLKVLYRSFNNLQKTQVMMLTVHAYELIRRLSVLSLISCTIYENVIGIGFYAKFCLNRCKSAAIKISPPPPP